MIIETLVNTAATNKVGGYTTSDKFGTYSLMLRITMAIAKFEFEGTPLCGRLEESLRSRPFPACS